MTENLVIVAVPSKDDYVWNISSEKVPHMTLLFLGGQKDAETTGRIVDYVEHAARTSLRRFGMSVDSRGELGADKADVLYFNKSFGRPVARFRESLLANDDISTAYQTADQFPGWTPHLTLGYPETPAKRDTRDYPGTTWVNFDRIAVWTGDFEGPEFELASDEGMELAMSAAGGEAVQNVLAHYGVKGMHWGVRKRRGVGSDGPEGVTVKVKKGHGVVETSGGHHHEVSAEAVRAAAVRQVAKTSSPSALTNKDLQDAINRMNLEKNYSKLMLEQAPKKGAARQFIEQMLVQHGQTELQRVLKGERLKTMDLVDELMKVGAAGKHRKL
jgi:2'-5' RNA ligase